MPLNVTIITGTRFVELSTGQNRKPVMAVSLITGTGNRWAEWYNAVER
jgi:hypothetical protein